MTFFPGEDYTLERAIIQFDKPFGLTNHKTECELRTADRREHHASIDAQEAGCLAAGAIALLAIVGFGGNQYVKAHSVDFVEVYRNGNLVGEVNSQDQVNQLISRKQSDLTQNNPNITMELEHGLRFRFKIERFKSEPNTSSRSDLR